MELPLSDSRLNGRRMKFHRSVLLQEYCAARRSLDLQEYAREISQAKKTRSRESPAA
jgi:hypothetical protein